MTTPNKYREFWIAGRHNGSLEAFEFPCGDYSAWYRAVRVVEHSALVAEQQKCEQWKAIAMEMREVIRKSSNIIVSDECEECGTFKEVRYEITPVVESLAKFDQRVEELK